MDKEEKKQISKSSIFNYFIIVLVSLGLFGIGFFLGYNWHNRNIISQNTSATTTSTPTDTTTTTTLTPTPTVQSSYTNNQLGYSLTVPSNMTYKIITGIGVNNEIESIIQIYSEDGSTMEIFPNKGTQVSTASKVQSIMFQGNNINKYYITDTEVILDSITLPNKNKLNISYLLNKNDSVNDESDFDSVLNSITFK